MSLSAGAAYVAPRLLLNARLSPTTDVAIAIDRRHQFDAIAGEPEEGSITQPVFLLRAPRVAETTALSARWHPTSMPGERRVNGGLTLYARRYHDRLVAISVVGPAGDAPVTTSVSDAPPGFRRVPGDALGASLSGDLVLDNGIVMQGSYTLQRARETVDGRHRPASWDAPQQLAVFAGLPLGRSWTLTSTAQLHSGAAVTPVAARIFVPQGGDFHGQRFIYGEPNGARLPTYLRVDAGLRHGWSGWGARWTLSIQAINVLARTNVLAYDWEYYFACRGNPACTGQGVTRQGLPFLPSLGIEARW